MQYLLIRHSKTDANHLNRAAFGVSGAPLNSEGLEQAKKLKKQLQLYDFDFATEPVAVSELLRTRETARLAGFANIIENSLLNEINTANAQNTLDLVAKNKLPQEALDAARTIINNPPKQRIWVTHGLLIAAILVELGLSNPDKFVPDYCEIRQIDL